MEIFHEVSRSKKLLRHVFALKISQELDLQNVIDF